MWHKIERQLDEIERLCRLILATTKEDMQAIDDLTAQVTANNTVIGAALVLINGIAAQITAAGTNGPALANLTAQLKSQDEALAAAIAANTAAAPIASVPPSPAVTAAVQAVPGAI
jgi:hypothetical protein